VISTLLKILPLRRTTLETALQGVDGYTGRGEIEFAIPRKGGRQLGIELRGVAGRAADLYANDAHIAAIDLDNGRADKFFDSRKGDPVPALIDGTPVEIRQNGHVILKGVLTVS